MQESRRYVRLKILIPCGIRSGQVETKSAWGHIHDISIGGVELHSYFPISKGQVIFLTFNVNDSYNFVNAKSTVVRVREDQGYTFAGIAFDNAVDKNHLRDALQAILDRE